MLLTAEKGRFDKIHISIDGVYKMTVDESYWCSLGIGDKAEIDPETLERLSDGVNRRRAFNKAVELISVREHSRHEVIEKLRQKGYESVAAETADRLEEYGYLDDMRFARMYARELSERKGYGKSRIKHELYGKGITGEVADTVLSEIEDDPLENIKSILLKKYPRFTEDDKIKQRAVNGLLRYGYCYSDIKKVIGEFDISEQT